MTVQFNEPSYESVRRPVKTSSFSSLVIKMGLAKTERGAQLALLIVAFALILIAGFLFMKTNTKPPAPTPEQVAL